MRIVASFMTSEISNWFTMVLFTQLCLMESYSTMIQQNERGYSPPKRKLLEKWQVHRKEN
jgi:hypothetical protein